MEIHRLVIKYLTQALDDFNAYSDKPARASSANIRTHTLTQCTTNTTVQLYRAAVQSNALRWRFIGV